MSDEHPNALPVRGASAIGVVVAAHAPIATAMLDAATRIVGPEAAGGVVALDVDSEATTSVDAVTEAVKSAQNGEGVVILADLFGGTAANLALAHLGDGKIEVVTGVNLAMLIDVLTNRSRAASPNWLAGRASDAAKKSVVVASDLLGASPVESAVG